MAEIWAAVAATLAAVASGGALYLQYRARHLPLRDELYRTQLRLAEAMLPRLGSWVSIVARLGDTSPDLLVSPKEALAAAKEMRVWAVSAIAFYPDSVAQRYTELVFAMRPVLSGVSEIDDATKDKVGNAVGELLTAFRECLGTRPLSADLINLASSFSTIAPKGDLP